ncbi:MAG: hypothetical protein HN952_04570 [Candidatus Cloacimonetes bacterium]|nr:hypothetical protein [Candidatus Cloacimonadota bacterium]MBT6994213.1 hypothetical protein [Candidatus Cloacimonadota bacterium]MBT7469203.1 hypothetical protein [Candidatus Cloacimonadota bacterium]
MTLALLIALVLMIGCSANVHTVGNGPQNGKVTTARQWYLISGLVPMNEVDMTVATTNYEIKTEQTFVDGFISWFTGNLITVRTVTITE